MKKKEQLFQFSFVISLIFLLTIVPTISNMMLGNHGTNSSNTNFNDETRVKSSDWWDLGIYSIFIDGDAVGVGAHNWTWAVSQDWCDGLGTWGAPYIIENVSINCNGTDYGILIRDSNAFFRIQNCTLFNSGIDSEDAAIQLFYVTRGTIYNNTFTRGHGIYTLQSDNISITENLFKDNHLGIFPSSSDNIRVIDNTFKNHSYHAIRTSGGNYHQIVGNTMENCFGSGVYTNGDYMNITGNIMFNNTRGITIEHSEGNNVEDNYIYDCEYGMRLLAVRESNFTNNEMFNHTRYGLYIDSWCYENNFTDNSMMNCGLGIPSATFDDMILYDPIDSTNTINTRPIHYYINETGLISDEFNNAGQVILINCNDSIVSNANTSYSTNGILLYYCENITITDCDMSNNLREGVIIEYGADNKILYSTVNNNGLEWDGGGIEISRSPYTYLYNNTIKSNFRSGIRISLCNHSSIIDNTVKYNGIHTGDGIVLYYSSWCEVIGNIAIDNDEFGINLLGDYCNITSNVARGNEHGIYIWGEYNNLTGNIANGNLEKGFYIWEDNNYFTENIANLNGEDGYYFQETAFHMLFNNSASENWYSGFHFLNCNNITLLENTLMDHQTSGIQVVNGENYTIKDNDFLNNGEGVYLEDSSYILVSNNYIRCDTGIHGWDLYHSNIVENDLDYNPGGGVVISYGEDNLISDNTMNYCGTGLYLGNVIDSTISNNEININIERGIWLYQCQHIDILDNNASYNVYGIWSSESTDIYVFSNTFNNNSEHGIIFVRSENNEITGNTINNNTLNGIYLWDASNFNTITNNLLYWNNRCIVEQLSSSNTISGNTCVNRPSPDDGDGLPPIPGYDVLLLTIISMTMIFYILKKRKIKINNN